jgi:surface antigen
LSRKVIRVLIAAVLAAAISCVAVVPAFAAPTPAPSPAQSPTVDQLSQQANAAKTKLDQLSNQVEGAQGKIDLLNRRLEQDQVRQKQLAVELTQLARMEYELPSLSLTTILQARSVDQLLSAMAQSRLVAAKQHDLLRESEQIHDRDAAARRQAARELATLNSARDEAAKIAAQVQAQLQTAQAAQSQALARQAQELAQMSAPTRILPLSSQSGGTNPNRFAPGQCTWYVASKVYVPWLGNARDWWPNARTYGYAEGQTPQVGAIMVSNDSVWGHVSLVTAVDSTGWTVTEMNYQGPYVVDSRHVTPATANLIGFIYGAH